MDEGHSSHGAKHNGPRPTTRSPEASTSRGRAEVVPFLQSALAAQSERTHVASDEVGISRRIPATKAASKRAVNLTCRKLRELIVSDWACILSKAPAAARRRFVQHTVSQSSIPLYH